VSVLSGVDRASFAIGLTDRLRRRGASATTGDAAVFAAALERSPLEEPLDVYWVGRLCLVHRACEIPIWDELYRLVFEAVELDVGRPGSSARGAPSAAADDERLAPVRGTDGGPEQGSALPWATLPALQTAVEAEDEGVALPQRLPSELSAIGDQPFDALDPADLARLGEWLEQAFSRWPTRRSRRLEPRTGGPYVDLRRTLGRARRTGWEPAVLVRSAHRRRPRRLVLVCDVSRSMEAYATSYLHLMRAAVQASDAEVFAFATELSRLTPVLAHRSVDVALERAGAVVTDRFGGTRIASNLTTLLRSRHGDLLRGAVVVIASDGWDSDPPEQLDRVMARLRRRAYRVFWLNPRAGAEGFEPRVGAMAAALPYCDRLLPAHTLRALVDAIAVVSDGRAPPTGSVTARA